MNIKDLGGIIHKPAPPGSNYTWIYSCGVHYREARSYQSRAKVDYPTRDNITCLWYICGQFIGRTGLIT